MQWGEKPRTAYDLSPTHVIAERSLTGPFLAYFDLFIIEIRNFLENQEFYVILEACRLGSTPNCKYLRPNYPPNPNH